MANEQRRGMGRRMGGRMTVEKPKDFKGSIGKLFAYMKQYHAAVLIVMLCAIASTVFSVIGPDILGKATTELSNGLLAKIQGTGSINFTKIGHSLVCPRLIPAQLAVQLCTGLDYERCHAENLLPDAKRHLRKNQPHANGIL